MMGPASLTEEVQVVGRAAEVLTQTAQVATNFKQELIATLPTNRDLNAYLLLAPAVHPTRTERRLFDFRVGVVREPVPGQRRDREREPPRGRPTISTSRTRSRRPRSPPPASRPNTAASVAAWSMWSPSRAAISLPAPSVSRCSTTSGRTLTPFEDRSIAADPLHKEPRLSKVVPTQEYTLGGPILKDRLWFFTAGRIQNPVRGEGAGGHQHPVCLPTADPPV